MSKQFTFPCGCSFPIKEENNNGILIEFSPTIDKIPLNCQRTWDLISSGNTKGIFQVESQLGMKMCKDIKPQNIDELSAVISLMRPSCMESGMTENYIKIRNGEKVHESKYPIIDEITKKNYYQIIYQEDNLQIAKQIAGFTLKEANSLRKAIGKKIPELMAKVRKEFITKAVSLGKVNQEQAEEIFNIIEKAQRYQFNKSHAVAYALNGYLSAYCKAHLPRIFFTSYLKFAKLKIKPKEEIRNLVNNARAMDIDVCPPNFLLLNKRFKLHHKKIYFGLLDIKGVGESGMNELLYEVKLLQKPLESFAWFDFLILLSDKLKSTVVEALICSGALPYKESRTSMLFEYKQYSTFTDREREWLKANYTNYKNLQELVEAITTMKTGKGKPISSSRRLTSVQSILKLLKNPPYSLKDSIPWIAATEESLLGISMTCTPVDNCDTSTANCTCKDFLSNNELTKNPILAVNIEEVKEYNNKKGDDMAFIKASDTSGVLESIVVFSDQWKQFKQMLVQGNTVLIGGKRGQKDRKDSFVVNKVWQI